MHEIQVAVAGHILNERVIFPDHELYPVLGSPAAYSSICLASLGVDVGVVTTIGRDFPEALLRAFDHPRLNRDGIRGGETSTCNELIYNPDGHKTLRFMSRAEEIGIEHFPDRYLQADLIYVCPMDWEVDGDTIAKLSAGGRRLMADAGGFGGGTSEKHSVERSTAALKGLARYFEVVKASIEDLEYILGMAEEDYARGAAEILQAGARVAVVTLGAKGACVATAQGQRVLPAYLDGSAQFIDPTGAGDCFAAGFIAKYLESFDPYESALFGNAVTSYVIERTGGASLARMPSREIAEARAEELKKRPARP